MGCGSSKSAVAVVDNNNQPETFDKEKKTPSLDHFQIKSSNNSLQKTDTRASVSSLIDSNTKNRLNLSKKSLRDEEIRKPSTANSSKSGDSGVYEDQERLSSAKSQSSVNSKPPSGKKTSARQRLLRIDDQSLEQTKDDSSNSEVNIIGRPKSSRYGNLAFDLMMAAPETGNLKKRPDSLPALKRKKKRSKNIKTKEEIDKKMQEVEERRKLQELEKQMKAKQFQHLAIHTTVQPFKPENEDEEIEENEHKSISNEIS